MNLHYRIAIAVTPLLAIGGYFFADYYASKQREQEGPNHALILQGNCRPASNECVLEHDDLRISIRQTNDSKGAYYEIISSRPLDGAILAPIKNEHEIPLVLQEGSSKRHWLSDIEQIEGNLIPDRLRLACSINNALYLSEVTVEK